MKLHKFHNKHLGEYHTYEVNDVYEAIYAAKYPSVVLKLKDGEDLSSNKQAVAKMQLFKVQEKKKNFMEMLLKNRVQIIEPNTTTIIPGFSYIRYQNKKWKPIFLTSKKEGGLIGCDNFKELCGKLVGDTNDCKAFNKSTCQIKEVKNDNSSEFMEDKDPEINKDDIGPALQKTFLMKAPYYKKLTPFPKRLCHLPPKSC